MSDNDVATADSALTDTLAGKVENLKINSVGRALYIVLIYRRLLTSLNLSRRKVSASQPASMSADNGLKRLSNQKGYINFTRR